MYIAKLRLANVATGLGFDSTETLEEAIAHRSSKIDLFDQLAGESKWTDQNEGCEADIISDMNEGKSTKVVRYVQHDLRLSCVKRRRQGKAETDGENRHRSEDRAHIFSSLREEYDLLSQKYSSLRDAHEAIITRYKSHYRKWKAFKYWLFERVAGCSGKKALDVITVQERLRKIFSESDGVDNGRGCKLESAEPDGRDILGESDLSTLIDKHSRNEYAVADKINTSALQRSPTKLFTEISVNSQAHDKMEGKL